MIKTIKEAANKFSRELGSMQVGQKTNLRRVDKHGHIYLSVDKGPDKKPPTHLRIVRDEPEAKENDPLVLLHKGNSKTEIGKLSELKNKPLVLRQKIKENITKLNLENGLREFFVDGEKVQKEISKLKSEEKEVPIEEVEKKLGVKLGLDSIDKHLRKLGIKDENEKLDKDKMAFTKILLMLGAALSHDNCSILEELNRQGANLDSASPEAIVKFFSGVNEQGIKNSIERLFEGVASKA